jgi:thioredoxin 1
MKLMSSRFLRGAALALLLVAATVSTVAAGERTAFDEKAFAEAQAHGKSILVDISAPWCPTCNAQKPIIEKLSAEPQYQGLTIFEVDFDTRKDVLRKFAAQTQCTLIVFKGDKETGRSVGSTDADAIDALLRKAL